MAVARPYGFEMNFVRTLFLDQLQTDSEDNTWPARVGVKTTNIRRNKFKLIKNIWVNFHDSTLIDDTLDELSELFNFKQESSYLDSGENKILEDERAKLFNLIQAAKQRIIQEHSR